MVAAVAARAFPLAQGVAVAVAVFAGL